MSSKHTGILLFVSLYHYLLFFPLFLSSLAMIISGMMPPSPNKSKSVHKSSGKLFRHKDKERSGSSGSSSGSSGNNGSSSSSSSTSSNSSSSSCNNSSGKRDDPMELKDCPLTLPVVGALDHTRSLPRYTACKYSMFMH